MVANDGFGSKILLNLGSCPLLAERRRWKARHTKFSSENHPGPADLFGPSIKKPKLDFTN